MSPGVPEGTSGDWLATYSGVSEVRYATYDFTLSQAGELTWWVRLAPSKAPSTGTPSTAALCRT